MDISPAIEKKILSLMYCFETGQKDPNYATLTILPDGKNRKRQITYGALQTTEEGNLKVLIRMYIKANGQYKDIFRQFLPKIGVESLVDSKLFITTLQYASKEKVMMQVQDDFFKTFYYDPAMQWAEDNGFVLPLSFAVIFDSFIHSGGIPSQLRMRFAERVPKYRGNERRWIESYLKTRRAWLAQHQNRILRNTVYRADTFLDCIKNENFNFEDKVNVFSINKVLQ